MKVSVGTSPQAIYPDGYQDAITVTNTGSSDIFLDRTTAISPTESIRLVPGSYIVWDAYAPLFLLSSHAHGEAGIILNGETLGRHIDRKLALLLDGTGQFQNTQFPPYNENGVILDVSPYSGLIVKFQHLPGEFYNEWIFSGRWWENEPLTSSSSFIFHGCASENGFTGGPQVQTFYIPVDNPTILMETSKFHSRYQVFGTNQVFTEYAADWDATYRYPFARTTMNTGDFAQRSGMQNNDYVHIIKPMRNVHFRMNPAVANIQDGHRLTLNRVQSLSVGELRQYHYMKRPPTWLSNLQEVYAVFPVPRFTQSSLSYSGPSFTGVNGTFQAEY